MNFTKPAGSAFTQIGKHGSPKKSFPRHFKLTQLHQKTPASTQSQIIAPSTNHKQSTNSAQRCVYSSATQTNSHLNSISVTSTLPSLRLFKPSLFGTSISSLRHATTTSNSAPDTTTECQPPASSDSVPVETPLYPSAPPKPELLRRDLPNVSTTTLSEHERIITRAVRSNYATLAEGQFSRMLRSGNTPNVAIFNLMLKSRADSSSGRKTDTWKLLELYNEMATHFKPNDTSHSAVIRGLCLRFNTIADSLQCAKKEKTFFASGHLLEIVEQGRKRREKVEKETLLLETELTKTYNLLWDHFQSLSKKSPENYIRIGAVISAQTDASRMDELMRSMPEPAMTPLMYCYLINTYGCSNQFDRAKEFFGKALLINTWEKSDIAEIYHVFAKVCLKKGEFAEAIKVVEEVAAQQFSVGRLLSSIILECYETGNTSTAQEMLDKLEQKWPLLNATGTDFFASFLCVALEFTITENNMELASHLINLLLTRNLSHFNMAEKIARPLEKHLNFCLARARKEEGLKTVRLMLHCKITPDPKLVSSLLLSEGKFDTSLSTEDVDDLLSGITSNLIDPKRRAIEWAVAYRSLVKLLADGMIGSRRFALSVARLTPQDAGEPWNKFSTKVYFAANEKHPVIAQGEHLIALELASRFEDMSRIREIVMSLRNDNLVIPAMNRPTYDHVLNAISGDLQSLQWWRSNARLLTCHEPSLHKEPCLLVAKGVRTRKPDVYDMGNEANASVRRAALEGDMETVFKLLHKAVPALTFTTVHIVFQKIGLKKNIMGAMAMAKIIDDAAKREYDPKRVEFLSSMSASGLAISCIYGKDFEMAKGFLTPTAKAKPVADVYAHYLLKQKWSDPASSAYEAFQKALLHKIEPTVFFLNTVLHMFGEGRRLDYAFEVFDQFKKNRWMPDGITYASAISAAARAGNEEVVVELFSEYWQLTSQRKIIRSFVPFNVMMQYYVGVHKNRDAVLYYWNLLHKEGYYPSLVGNEIILQAFTCLLPVDMNRAENLMKKITRPAGSHFAALIFGYAYRLRDFDSANAVMDRMLQLLQNRTDSVIEPEKAWGALVTSYVAHREIRLAKQARDSMVQFMPRLPTLYLDNSLIRGCALFNENEDEHIRTARGLYNGIAPKLRTPDTYTAMIAVYQKFRHWECAMEVLTEMRYQKFPDRVVKVAENLVEESDPKTVENWVKANMLKLPALQ